MLDLVSEPRNRDARSLIGLQERKHSNQDPPEGRTIRSDELMFLELSLVEPQLHHRASRRLPEIHSIAINKVRGYMVLVDLLVHVSE